MERLIWISLVGMSGLLISSHTAHGATTAPPLDSSTPPRRHEIDVTSALPVVTTGNEPVITTAAVHPIVTTGAEQKEVTTGAVQPEVTTAAVKPEVTTPAVHPVVTTGAVQPAVTTGEVQPVITTHAGPSTKIRAEVTTGIVQQGSTKPPEVTTGVPATTARAKVTTRAPEVTTTATSNLPKVTTAAEGDVTASTWRPGDESSVHHSNVPERTTAAAESSSKTGTPVEPVQTTVWPPEVTTTNNSSENTTAVTSLSAFGGAAGTAIGVILALVVITGVCYYIYITVAGRIPALPGATRLREEEEGSVRFRSDTEMARLQGLPEESTEESPPLQDFGSTQNNVTIADDAT